MAFAYIFSALVLLLLVGGPILAAIALSRATALRKALGRANSRIESLEARLADYPSEEAEQPRPSPTGVAPEAEAATSDPGEPVSGLDAPDAPPHRSRCARCAVSSLRRTGLRAPCGVTSPGRMGIRARFGARVGTDAHVAIDFTRRRNAHRSR